jgi:hypothetical protein
MKPTTEGLALTETKQTTERCRNIPASRTKSKHRVSALILPLLTLLVTTVGAFADSVAVQETKDGVTISNQSVALSFQLDNRSFSVTDAGTGEVVLENAGFYADGWGRPPATRPSEWNKWTFRHRVEDVADGFGKGKRVVILMEDPKRQATPIYMFSYALYEGKSVVIMGFGVNNHRSYGIRVRTPQPMSGAKLVPTLETPLTLNGAAGAEHTEVKPGLTRSSANSLMLTGLVKGKRRTIVWGGLANKEFGKYASIKDGNLNLSAQDPLGRLVDPGTTYWSEDTLYLDIVTADPFAALEQYGRAMRAANNARPNVYDFPVLCGWSVGKMSKLPDINDSVKLVNELEAAQKCGLTKYTKVGIRLEPDTYCYADGNTEQGWWDDEHWAKYGHLVAPYDTFAKWCAAIRERDGVPYTYFQMGMPSDDYALAYPGHMLFNNISRLNARHGHEQPLVSYDYTDPDFRKHVMAMWQRLRRDGIRGIKFDYPETAWRPEGGFENRHATTVFAYREAFRLCREGLGEDAFLDERNIGESGRPCLDITAGLVDTQRNWTDSNAYVPAMVTISGLRWYKNRTVFNYFPDTKTVHNSTAPLCQSMLTMMFLTSGRLDLATSFSLFTPEIVHDFSRIYPSYREPFTARPLDAFTGVRDPQVYDLELTPDWHQVTLFNAGSSNQTIAVSLSGDRVTTGAIGLDRAASYYVYDFWRDELVGKLPGTAKVERRLSPLCCAMLSVRKAQPNPQVLSTSRHVLQGWVELSDVKWDAATKKLTGKANLIGGEPMRIVLAGNGFTAAKASSGNASAKLEPHTAGGDITVLVLESPKNSQVQWSVEYQAAKQ